MLMGVSLRRSIPVRCVCTGVRGVCCLPVIVLLAYSSSRPRSSRVAPRPFLLLLCLAFTFSASLFVRSTTRRLVVSLLHPPPRACSRLSLLSTSAAFTMLRLLIYLSRLLAAHILRTPAEKQRRPRRLRHSLFFVTHKSEAEKGIRVCRRHVCAVAVAQAGEDHFAGGHHRHGLALRVHLQAGPVA